MNRRSMPEAVPVLSRGKHRNPRKGACFMEYASYLAGERWSDHPRCTHPLLAGVARGVNDYISDSGRTRLVELIPAVVGLNGDDARLDAGIALRAAATALPVAAESRQRALAAGILVTRRVWYRMTVASDEFDANDVFEHCDRALAQVPHAAGWAEEFTAGARPTPRAVQSHSAPYMTRLAVVGIAEACIPNRDELLHELLASVIRDCTGWLDPVSTREATHVSV